MELLALIVRSGLSLAFIGAVCLGAWNTTRNYVPPNGERLSWMRKVDMFVDYSLKVFMIFTFVILFFRFILWFLLQLDLALIWLLGAATTYPWTWIWSFYVWFFSDFWY